MSGETLTHLFAAGFIMVMIGQVGVFGLVIRPAWPDELKEWFKDQWDPAWRSRGGHYNFAPLEKRLEQMTRHEIAKKATFGWKRLHCRRRTLKPRRLAMQLIWRLTSYAHPSCPCACHSPRFGCAQTCGTQTNMYHEPCC